MHALGLLLLLPLLEHNLLPSCAPVAFAPSATAHSPAVSYPRSLLVSGAAC